MSFMASLALNLNLLVRHCTLQRLMSSVNTCEHHYCVVVALRIKIVIID